MTKEQGRWSWRSQCATCHRAAIKHGAMYSVLGAGEQRFRAHNRRGHRAAPNLGNEDESADAGREIDARSRHLIRGELDAGVGQDAAARSVL